MYQYIYIYIDIDIERASALVPPTPFLIGGLATEGLVEILKARKELAWYALANPNLSPKLQVKRAAERFGEFSRLANGSLESKRTLPRRQGLVGAAGNVCRGLSGAWELQGRVWRVFKAGKRQP